ncbi:MAG TPA: UDP-N-acetylglucosamine 2-epimerase, partial [Bacillota bacterium]|nr:UDP-N-acetylglucosamine 2-epimerase [Bacillota bacterium]
LLIFQCSLHINYVRKLIKCFLVLTDSGGIQEEAPALGKPVLVLRDTTERPEAIQAGTVKLVGINPDSIVTETNYLLHNHRAYIKMANAINPYGDGKASQRIYDLVLKYLGVQ